MYRPMKIPDEPFFSELIESAIILHGHGGQGDKISDTFRLENTLFTFHLSRFTVFQGR